MTTSTLPAPSGASGPDARPEGLASLWAGGHEQVVFCHDAGTGLRAVIALSSTALGPGLGGTRFRPYPTVDEAVADVLELSTAMAYKNALAGLDHGGGKAVIIGDPRRDKTEALLRAYGRFVASLGGRYVTACDVGTYVEDMDVVARECRWVTGRSESAGGAGDSSVLTALGVFHGMRAGALVRWGPRQPGGARRGDQRRRQGRSAPGAAATGAGRAAGGGGRRRRRREAGPRRPRGGACRRLHRGAARRAPRRLRPVRPGPRAHPRGRGRAARRAGVRGSQQPAGHARGRPAARGPGHPLRPDYCVNAGGVIQVADELHGFSFERARARTERIYDTTLAVLRAARDEGVPPAEAADRLAERRMRDVGSLSRIHLVHG